MHISYLFSVEKVCAHFKLISLVAVSYLCLGIYIVSVDKFYFFYSFQVKCSFFITSLPSDCACFMDGYCYAVLISWVKINK